MALFGVITLMHIEDNLSRIDSLHESLELSVVRMRRVRHFEVERQVFVIFIIPAR